jgi:transcription initiation factor IIE alpha subunit
MQLCSGSKLHKFSHEEIVYSDDVSCPVCEEHDRVVDLESEIKDYQTEIEDLKAVIADIENE